MKKRYKLAFAALIGVGVTGTSISADLAQAGREEDLQKQIIELRKELNELKSLIHKQSDGSLRLNANLQVDKSINTSQLKDSSGELSLTSARNLNVNSGKLLVVNGSDHLKLQSGLASITLSKNGNIILTGTNIDIKGSSDVKIKGSKVNQN